MAITGSGEIKLVGDVNDEINGNTTDTNVSLTTLSTGAEKTAPHGLTEFYGYSSAITPSEHFQTVLYTGTDASHVVSGGKFGACAKFNGSSSFIDWGANSTAGISNNNITMSAWVNLKAYQPTTNHHSMIMTIQDDYYFWMGIVGSSNNEGLTSGRVVMSNNQQVSGDPNNGWVTESDTSISLNTWTHIAVTLSSSAGAKIYINGDLDKTQSGRTSNCTSQSGKSYLGAYRSGSTTEYYLNGKIDQVRAYNSVLTDSEISDLADETLADSFKVDFPTGKTSLVLYRLNGDTNDETGVNDATASNTTWEGGTSFTPDLVWLKARTDTRTHSLVDSVRGFNGSSARVLQSDSSGGQWESAYINSFNTGGFTLSGSENYINNSSHNYVGWCWNAGGSSTTNDDGSVDSTIRVNTAAGFSIQKHTVPSSEQNYTIGHGLGVKPDMVILKGLDANGRAWFFWHKDLSQDDYYLYLQDNYDEDEFTQTDLIWGQQAFTDEVISTRANYATILGEDYISYCWADVEGYQKTGKYTGNGNDSGTLVKTGFKPAFLLIKRIDAAGESWIMFDAARNTSNPRNCQLRADTTGAESCSSSGDEVNFYSNGFQPLSNWDGYNATGGTYIYYAVAADPETVTPVLTKSFKALTFTGNGGTKVVEGVGFKPDLVWVKDRDTLYQHNIYDSIRGVTNAIEPNGNAAEYTLSGLTSFNTDGFTLGSNAGNNQSNSPNIAWCWKAGNSTDILTTGTIDSITNVNDEAGFSIVKYTGTGSAGTIAHGLSDAPKFIIIKKLTGVARDWVVHHKDLTSATHEIYLNRDIAEYDSSGAMFASAPGSTLFSLGTDDYVNGSTISYIAYCWRPISGYSSFGTYEATESTGSPTITTGFQPDLVIVKNIDRTQEWVMIDSVRGLSNSLWPNLNSGEGSGNSITCNSTSFTINNSGGGTNYADGDKFIYAAFKMN